MADMFTIPASAMRSIIEDLRANPISYSYPHQIALAELAALMPTAEQEFIDFANYVGTQSQNLFNVLRQAESLAEKIADYDGVTVEEALAAMAGSLLPEFAETFAKWKELAVDEGSHPVIYAEMTAIVINEPAAFARAQDISIRIAETMSVIRAADAAASGGSKAGAVAMAAMAGNAANIIQQGLKALKALQQIADFGTSMPPPGQEFKSYLEGLSKSIEKAISSGNIQMIDGALKMVQDGVEKVLPQGIVDAYKTLVPEAGKLIDQVKGVVNSVDTTISEAQRAINKLKGQG